MSTGRIALALAKGTGVGVATGLGFVGMVEIMKNWLGVVAEVCPDPTTRLIIDASIVGFYTLGATPIWTTYFLDQDRRNADEERQNLLEPTHLASPSIV
jgi:hypothetical protein